MPLTSDQEVSRCERGEVEGRGGNAFRLTPLFAPQELFKRFVEFEEGGESGEGWNPIKSASRDVEMSMKYFPPKKRERSVATGRAEGIVDCSAEEVAAWFFNYCSNERVRRSMEKEKYASLVVENNAAPNEATVATVKAMLFPLKNRELILRFVWKSDEGSVTIPVESVDVMVDYGASINTVRARTRA